MKYIIFLVQFGGGKYFVVYSNEPFAELTAVKYVQQIILSFTS